MRKRIYVYEMDCYKQASEEQIGKMHIRPDRYFDLEGLPTEEISRLLEEFIWDRGKKLAPSSLSSELLYYNNIRDFLIDRNIRTLDAKAEEKIIRMLKGWMMENGYALSSKKYRALYDRIGIETPGIVKHMKKILKFAEEDDDRDEQEKDIWNLKNFDFPIHSNPILNMETINFTKITQPDINRPALQLAGYFEHFDATRLQIIGFVEYTYMEGLTDETRREAYEKLMAYDIPCIVFSRDLKPDPIFLETAIRHQIPVLSTKKSTSDFMSEIIRWLNVKLAPCISVHGVLVDVYGEGVLITGESGIGKSEAALELIRRGHRLVTDDVVELRKVSDDTLVGSAPDITKHFIELRGIGIVDVKALFGALSVKDTQTIDLVIRLEDWDKDKEYDRLGLEENYTEYLGNKVVCHNIPIRPGRNLAVICETAAINHRQKKMGYNAAKELYTRVQNSLAKRREEDEDDE